MPTEHSFIDIYSTLSCVSFLLSIVELRLSTLNKPISDLIWVAAKGVLRPSKVVRPLMKSKIDI